MFNKLVLMGRLTRDIELRHANSGMQVANAGLAVSEKRKDGNESVVFIDVTFFGRTAEVVAEHFHKGDPILVDGVLAQDNWEKDGQKRSKLKMIANSFSFIPGNKEYDPAGPQAAPPDPTPFGANQPETEPEIF